MQDQSHNPMEQELGDDTVNDVISSVARRIKQSLDTSGTDETGGASVQLAAGIGGRLVKFLDPAQPQPAHPSATAVHELVLATAALSQRVFFSHEWPAPTLSNDHPAVVHAGPMKSAAKDVFDAAQVVLTALWTGVLNGASSKTPGNSAELDCRSLYCSMYDGLLQIARHSARLSSHSGVPKALRSHAMVGWTCLVKLMAAPELAGLIAEGQVQEVLQCLFECLSCEAAGCAAAAAGPQAADASRVNFMRFWVQNVAKIVGSHQRRSAASPILWHAACQAAKEVFAAVARLRLSQVNSLPEQPEAAAVKPAVTLLADLQQHMVPKVVGILMRMLLSADTAANALAAAAQSHEEPPGSLSVVDKVVSLQCRLPSDAPSAARGSPRNSKASAVADDGSGGGGESSTRRCNNTADFGAAAEGSGGGSSHTRPCDTVLGEALLSFALMGASAGLPTAVRCAYVQHLMPHALRGLAVTAYAECLATYDDDNGLSRQAQSAMLALSAACVSDWGAADGVTGSAEHQPSALEAWLLCQEELISLACEAHPLVSAMARDVLCTLAQHAEPGLVEQQVWSLCQLLAAAAAAEAMVGGAEGDGRPAAQHLLAPRVAVLLAAVIKHQQALDASATFMAHCDRLVLSQPSDCTSSTSSDGDSVCAAAAVTWLWRAWALAAVPPADPTSAAVQMRWLGGRLQRLGVQCDEVRWLLRQAGVTAPEAAVLSRQLHLLLEGVDVTLRSARALMTSGLLEHSGALAEAVSVSVRQACQLLTDASAALGSSRSNSSGAVAAPEYIAAALQVVARGAECVPQQVLASLPLLQLLQVTPEGATHVAALCGAITQPPMVELFHTILQQSPWALRHEALESLVRASRQVDGDFRCLIPPAAPSQHPPITSLLSCYLRRQPSATTTPSCTTSNTQDATTAAYAHLRSEGGTLGSAWGCYSQAVAREGGQDSTPLTMGVACHHKGARDEDGLQLLWAGGTRRLDAACGREGERAGHQRPANLGTHQQGAMGGGGDGSSKQQWSAGPPPAVAALWGAAATQHGGPHHAGAAASAATGLPAPPPQHVLSEPMQRTYASLSEVGRTIAVLEDGVVSLQQVMQSVTATAAKSVPPTALRGFGHRVLGEMASLQSRLRTVQESVRVLESGGLAM